MSTMKIPSPLLTVRNKPLRVLALDGGGVRGLSSLLILHELMNRISIRTGILVRPCDYFELIIGTGTGGISALFVGRLGMSVDKAIEAYLRVAETAFMPRSGYGSTLRAQKVLLDGAVLDETIGEIVKQILGDRNATLATGFPHLANQCQTAVLAATSDRADSPPYIFRSYTNDIQAASAFTIREVACATAAAAGIFTPVALGNPPINFIDAGVAGYSNPAEIGLRETEQLWPGQKIHCFVSLGTGLQKIVSLDTNISKMADACRVIVESCEQVHDRIVHSSQGRFPYFRFNVDRGLDGIDIMEWSNAGPRGKLSGITNAYMRWREVDNRLNSCVGAMSGKGVVAVSSPENVDSTEIRRETRRFLPMLNPSPDTFHGRHQEVKNAVTALIRQETAARIVILGAGGIGKTSIALKLLHDARVEEHFKGHRRFIDCEGIVSISSLTETLCAAFALRDVSANERREELVVFLNKIYTSCRLLLILDNFETVWDVEGAQRNVANFLRDLGSVASLSLVLTMRGAESPGGIHWSSVLHIGPLDLDAARTTFMSLRNRTYWNDDQLDELLRAVDCVPLAITLMARLGQNVGPAELLRRWTTEEKTDLLSRPGDDKHRLTRIDISVDISIKSHRMQCNPDALRLLSAVSVLPSGVRENQLPKICPKIPNVPRASATLREVALAYSDATGTFRILSPIRFHVLKHYQLTPELLKDIQTFYFEQARQAWLHQDEVTYMDVMDTLTCRGPNIEAVIFHALTRAAETGDGIECAMEALDHWKLFLERSRKQQVEYDHLIAMGISNKETRDWAAAVVRERQTIGPDSAVEILDDARGTTSDPSASRYNAYPHAGRPREIPRGSERDFSVKGEQERQRTLGEGQKPADPADKAPHDAKGTQSNPNASYRRVNPETGRTQGVPGSSGHNQAEQRHLKAVGEGQNPTDQPAKIPGDAKGTRSDLIALGSKTEPKVNQTYDIPEQPGFCSDCCCDCCKDCCTVQ